MSNKYLLAFDLETTGLSRSDCQIIQFASVKYEKKTLKEVSSKTIYIQPTGSYKMSMSSYFKHGIHPDFLKDKPYMKDVAQEIVDEFNDADILTYNGATFDIPFLLTELNKYGYTIDFMSKKCYDAFLEEKRRHGINLENTYKKYVGKTMEESGLSAHNALSDVKATFEVFKAQMKENKYAPEKMYGEDNAIVDMNFSDKLCPCFNLGKYKFISVKYVCNIDPQYIDWCISDKSTFMKSTKDFILKIKNS